MMPLLAAACCLALQAPQDPPPRAVVVVVVDQLAQWVFDEAAPHLNRGGFARVVRRGTRFSRCAFAHATTLTGPGHATIATGVPSRVHGIIGNELFDQETRAKKNCVPDGSPEHLVAPTVGDLLAERRPGARVVSLGGKDRTAVLTAGHRADAAVWLDVRRGRFVTSSHYADPMPAWLDRLAGREVVQSFFGRRWARSGEPAAYEGLVDDRPFEGPDPNGERTLPMVVDGGGQGPGFAYGAHLYYSPFSNDALLLACDAALEAYGIGEDDVPDLLYVGLSATDTVGHRFGPRSVEARDTLLRCDEQLAALWRMLDARIGDGRYAVVLTADHGVAPAPESLAAYGAKGERDVMFDRRIAAAAERALAAEFGAPDGDARYVAAIVWRCLHLDRRTLAARAVDPNEAARVAAAALVEARGIAVAVPTSMLAERAAAADAGELVEALYEGTFPGRSGDVVFETLPHWNTTPVAAMHGTGYPYDREVPLIAVGPGLAPGRVCDAPVTPGVAAALAARWLGIDPPEGAEAIPPPAFAR